MRFLWIVVALFGALAPAAHAYAHGRPPLVGELHFDPSDPDHIVARATWGLVETTDGGETWQWMCAAVIGFEPTLENPAFIITGDRSMLFGNFQGLSRSTPDSCEWGIAADIVSDTFVIAMDARAQEPDTIWFAITRGFDVDLVLRTQDGGRTIDEVAQVEDVLFERVKVAPSDPSRVYLSGFRLETEDTPRTGALLRSDDGGETYDEFAFPLGDGERNLHVLAVDPSDPARLWARVLRRVTDVRDERIVLSEDGGETWETVLEARNLLSLAVSSDGARVFAGSREGGGLFRSIDAGRTFEPIADGLSVTWIEARGPLEVWYTIDQLRDGYAIGRTLDGGDTLEEVYEFQDTGGLPPQCGMCTGVGGICPQWFPDLAADLELMTSMPLPDAATGLPRDASLPAMCIDGSVEPMMPPDQDGCGCRAAGTPSSPPVSSLLVLGLAALLIRRRARSTTLARR